MESGNSVGAQPRLGASDLADRLASVSLDVRDVCNKPSCALTIPDMADVATRIRGELDAGATGVVVTQGTDTMEETAFALDIMLDSPQPVIVTGAMRAADAPGADGAANIEAAACAAASPECSGCGVLVSFDGELHAARYVIKYDAVSLSAFRSPLSGPVGRLSEGRVLLMSRPASPAFHVNPDVEPASVALVTVCIGDDGSLVQAAAAGGAQGIVVAAMGGGHVPPPMADVLGSVAENIPVLLCSRAPAGRVLQQTYGYSGGDIDLLRRGLIPAGWLTPVKARILLSLALGAGWDIGEIRGALRLYGG